MAPLNLQKLKNCGIFELKIPSDRLSLFRKTISCLATYFTPEKWNFQNGSRMVQKKLEIIDVWF